MHLTIPVENIKCGGCTNSIRKTLEQLPGVQAAQADAENGTVTVDFNESLIQVDVITDKLSHMGYPALGENTFGKKAISYVSCMIGRLDQ